MTTAIPDAKTDKAIANKDAEFAIQGEEASLIGQDPFKLVEHGFLTIKTKKDGLKRLIPNFIQRKFIKSIKEALYNGKPVRVLILKARQAGLSTIVEAIIYAFTSRMKGVNACVISDDLDGSNYIFEMQKLYHEYLDDHLKPSIKHSNEKKLSFLVLNSQILIETADNANVGRKFTFQFVHGTEVSRWTSSLLTIMSGLGHAVPFAAGTMIFLETTANGYEEFYELWVKAINGKTDWIPLFYPWFEIPENTLAVVSGELYPLDNIKFVTPVAKDNFLKEEARLKLEYKLTDEQLNWRRWDIVNNCSGDMNKFNEDNPACWQDAFVATGDLFFDREALKLQKSVDPLFVGNIVKEEFKYIFREDPTGLFKIYELPVRGGQYIVSGDAAEGLEHGDKSGAVVINKRTNKTVCVYNHNVPPESFSFDLMLMGHYYNTAIIGCENKGYGYTVNQDLFKNYGKVYRRVTTKKGVKIPTMELGFNTNKITRPTILAQLAEEILARSTDLLDQDLIGQCWTFINNAKKGRPEADVNKNDDLVMARAIASQMRVEKPYKDASLMGLRRKKKRFKGLTGY